MTRYGGASATLERGGLGNSRTRPVMPSSNGGTEASHVAQSSQAEFASMPKATRWVVAGAIFLSISKFHGYFPILATIRATLILSVIAILMLFGTLESWRPTDLGKHWIPKLIGLIVVIAIVSIPSGIYPGQSFETFNEMLSRTVLLAVMVWASARTREGTRFMAQTITLACVGAAFLAFVKGRTDSAGRLAGGYAYDPNDIALIAVVGIPLCIWWVIDQRNKFRGAMLLAFPLFLRLIVKSQSRGGFLALLAVTGGFLLLGMGKSHPSVRRAGIIIGTFIALSIPLLPGTYLDQMRTITDQEDYNRTSPRGRIEVWTRGMGYATDYPLLGVGLGNFGTAEGRLSAISQERAARRQGWKWGAAHNSFVQIAAELGLIAGSAFVILILGSIAALVQLHRKRRDHADLLPPLLALSILGFAVAGFFLSWAYYDLTYALLALAAAVLMLPAQAEPPSLAQAQVKDHRRPRLGRGNPIVAEPSAVMRARK